MVSVSQTIPAIIPARQCCFFGILRLIQPESSPAIMLVIKQGTAVTPPISIRYRWVPAMMPVIIPTQGPKRIPPDMTAMMRTFTSEPSTGTPDQVLNRANIEKINVTASSSFGEWADLCNSSRNKRMRIRKKRQISINAARSNTARSILKISCTVRPGKTGKIYDRKHRA
ncbi:Uncharacterised protein [Enterobacter cloacae]|nr:Uncharacterised protein [Enterobacter cloacae]